MITFINQQKANRKQLLDRERALEARETTLKEKEEDLENRISTQLVNENALDELLKEAKRPEQDYEELRKTCAALEKELSSLSDRHQKQLDRQKKTIEALTQRLERTKEQSLKSREAARAAKESLKNTRKELSLANEGHLRLKKEHDLLCEEYDLLSEDHDLLNKEYLLDAEKLSSAIARIKQLEKVETRLNESEKRNRSLGDQLTTLKLQKKRFRDSDSSAACVTNNFELLDAFSSEVSEPFITPEPIVTLGSGPFPESEFDDYLTALTIRPVVRGSDWIIVGREDWSEAQLDDLIDNADLDHLRVFSQELFVTAFLTGHDPFSQPLEVLMKFAEGHPALEYLIKSGFEWPITLEEGDYGEPVFLRSHYDTIDESPLSKKGYHVGITNGLSVRERRRLLKDAYMKKIPSVADQDYMEEWGTPKHSKRLWRIAHHLAWLIRSRRSRPSMQYAVNDWLEDLDWLHDEFYTNRMRFTWPVAK